MGSTGRLFFKGGSWLSCLADRNNPSSGQAGLTTASTRPKRTEGYEGLGFNLSSDATSRLGGRSCFGEPLHRQWGGERARDPGIRHLCTIMMSRRPNPQQA
jgi:hypothetical protein